MSSESRLYTVSTPTRDLLRKFRLSTSRAKDPQAMICLSLIVIKEIDHIDKATLEIQPVSSTTYTSLEDIADELPDNSPRYVLLSYPLVMASGRQSVPYVLLSYLPPTCSSEQRMLYAGARELMRNSAEVNRVIEIDDAEEVVGIEERLKGED